MSFSNLTRSSNIEHLKNQVFDVLVIGGGITGAGIALDAVTRGMKTAMVEMQDFAAGTSSRSTKLIHGGLRYLKQFEVKMVAEVGRERAIVYKNGPHVTTPVWMMLPIYKGGTFGKVSTAIGLAIYDRLAGVNRKERRTMLTAEQTLKIEPLLKKENLLGSGLYVEYRTDDARLTIEVIKSANDHGMIALNYTKVVQFIIKNETVMGVIVEDQFTGESFPIYAKKIVNSTGPWVEEILALDKGKNKKSLQLTKGVHIVIDQSLFPLKQAVYFDTADGRMVFAIPREGKTYVGTTDTFYHEDKVNPVITKEDCDYLIEAIHYMFPEINLKEFFIESSWAGIRPLIYEQGKTASEISRKDEIWESHTGLITIAGGKLTGYRKMAETIVDLLAKQLTKITGRTYSVSKTKNLPISGGHVGGPQNFEGYAEEKAKIGLEQGLTIDESKELVMKYGSNIDDIYRLLAMNKKDAERYGLPTMLLAKLLYAIHFEMAATPADFFIRRTGALLFNIQWVCQWKNQVIDYMKDVFQWDEKMIEEMTKDLETSLELVTLYSKK